MMSFVGKKSVFVAIFLMLLGCAISPPIAGQTLAQEKRFEECCQNSTAIRYKQLCSYRELKGIEPFHATPNHSMSFESKVAIAVDNRDPSSVNKAWADFLPCLNNGKDNGECCYASTNPAGKEFMKECTPLCSGLPPKDGPVDIDKLGDAGCTYYWQPIIACAIKAA